MVQGRCLAEMLAGVPLCKPVPSLTITALTLDSRTVTPGAAFVALPGTRSTHGLLHAAEALRRGAAVVLYDPKDAPSECMVQPAFLGVPGLRDHLGHLARGFYFADRPQPMLLGVTGTSGKTTTAFLAAQLLDGWQGRCAYLGTVGHGFPEALVSSSMTTPDVLTLHGQLASLGAAGARRVVCEVSSHALDQGRLDGLEVAVAAFGNLGRDHLDYHGDMQHYASAKARLFARGELKTAVVNANDPHAACMLQQVPSSCRTLLCLLDAPAGQAAADGLPDMATAYLLTARCLQEAPELQLAMTGSWGSGMVVARHLWGACNAENLLLAVAMALAAGRPFVEVLAAAQEIRLPPGRFETFARADGVQVVVDYAHKPEALASALRACRGRAAGRLICVFGCGGNRDQGKRPLMGAAAAAGADVVWITDDNPRNEDPAAITTAIESGLRDAGVPYHVCHDRAAAIAEAIAGAQPGDVVLVAGKGHETSQERHGIRHVFDDRAVVRACLAAEGAMA